MMFEIEITRFEPEPVTSRTTVLSASDAEATVRAGAGGDAYVLVAWNEGGVSVGEMHIWLAADRALVQLDEHREWYAYDPATIASAAAGEAWFRDSDCTEFPAQVAETVSRSQALAALGHWLRNGEMLRNLGWH